MVVHEWVTKGTRLLVLAVVGPSRVRGKSRERGGVGSGDGGGMW